MTGVITSYKFQCIDIHPDIHQCISDSYHIARPAKQASQDWLGTGAARQQDAYLESKAGGFNLFLAGHEDEYVPCGVAQVDGNSLLHSSLHIVLLGRLAEQGLHRERAPRDLEDRHAAEEV